MKTNKFEKTIRQKLESISPDFHEEDWTKMQNYMQVHTPPTFWQQYGSWLGYAAAASVSTVMAFLYINQLSQNNNLVSDVKKLQNQIEVIKTAPAVVPKVDTIYIVQKELASDKPVDPKSQNFTLSEDNDENNTTDNQKVGSQIVIENNELISENYIKNEDHPVIDGKDVNTSKPTDSELSKEEKVQKTYNVPPTERSGTSPKSVNSELLKDKPTREFTTDQSGRNYGENITYNQPSINTNSSEPAGKSNSFRPPVQNSTKILSESFEQIAEIKAIPLKNNSRQMSYSLVNRLSPRQVKKVWLASVPTQAKPVVGNKKVEKTNKTENVIPKLNLKVPYRFGGGIQFEGRNQIKTVLGEVLFAKKFSFSAGVSWLKVKPVEFFTEKIFRDKNSKDFKRSHPNEVPMAFEIVNINVKPTLVQIPLTVAFRNDLNHHFSYFVGAGTNVTVKGREAFSFDCRVPYSNPQFINQAFERKMDIPVVNSLNFSAGIEKTWHPVVVQVEGYLYTYFKPMSLESQRTGPGVKFKLMYQIGRKL